MNKKLRFAILQFAIAMIIAAAVITIDQVNTYKAEAKANEKQVSEAGTGTAGISEVFRQELHKGFSTEQPKKEKAKVKKKKSAEKPKIDENELYVLAHVIDGEGRGQEDAFKWLVGAVVLNRVKADIYPNSIYEVVFQSGQYACTWDGNFSREPEESSWIMARQLLTYGITDDQIPASVTGQSAARQGKVWLEYKCSNGVTCYFCHNKYLLEE